MGDRSSSGEHYVLDLCDEALGMRGLRQFPFEWLRGDPSPSRRLGTKLPVDAHWSSLGLVVEFQEEQHSRPSPFFDRRQTVSGVGRGEPRRFYDARKRDLVPRYSLRLVVIEKSAFAVRSKRIARDRAADLGVVPEHLAASALSEASRDTADDAR
jgi:hypothetical protein